jgi:flagellar hook-associated protein 2
MRISGAVSGIDTETMVRQLIDLERGPVIKYEARQSLLQAQQSAWRVLASTLGNLESKLEALQKPATFLRSGAHSSDGRVVSAISNNPPPANYSITVRALALQHSVASTPHGADDVALGITGTAMLNGHELQIGSADTLRDVAARINAEASYGVRANTVQVSPGQYRLVMTSTETGTANAIRLASADGTWTSLGVADAEGAPRTVQAAQDADFDVDGLTVTSGSNTVEGVIPGVTLTLVGPGQAQIRTARDLNSAVTAIQEFVAAYNAFVDFAKGQLTYDPQKGGPKPPLHGQTALRQLHFQMRTLATQALGGLPEDTNALWRVGVSTGNAGAASGREGKLVVDEAKLREALTNNVDGVRALFGADAAGAGVTQALLGYTRQYTASRSGLLDLRSESIDREVRTLRRQVDQANERLIRREDHLRSKFLTMEKTLSTLQNQASWLNMQLSQLTANSSTRRR